MISKDIDHDLHTNKDIQQKYSIVNQFDNSDTSSIRSNIISLKNMLFVSKYLVLYVEITIFAKLIDRITCALLLWERR